MSPRRPQVLRDSDDHDLRRYLIVTAARLIGERGGARLSVRDIAREARVADGVLYNYFEDREDLLAQALLTHVGSVMSGALRPPPAGTGTVAGNLASFIDNGLDVLARVTPAFAGLLSQPKVLNRFYTMVGAGPAFGAGTGDRPDAEGQRTGAGGESRSPGGGGPRSLPEILVSYLRAEQRLGRVSATADIDAAAKLVTGAIHGQVLPPLLFNPPGTVTTAEPDLARRLADTILSGIAPGPPDPPAHDVQPAEISG